MERSHPQPPNPVTPIGRVPSLLLAGFEPSEALELKRLLGSAADVEAAGGESEAIARMERGAVEVFCAGPKISGARAKRLLDELIARAPESRTLHLVTAGGADPSVFQDLIDEDRIFYLSFQPLASDDLAALLESALARATRLAGPPANDDRPDPSGLSPDGEDRISADRAQRERQVLEAVGRLSMERDPAAVAGRVREDLIELLTANRAHLLLYDPATEALWEKRGGIARDERRESAAVGLVSFVARTGRSVEAAVLAEDPRFERDADDPEGEGKGPFCAAPILGANGRTVAVLSALRDPGRERFAPRDLETLALYADRATPAIRQLVTEARLQDEKKQKERALRDRALDVFREEALDHHNASARREGDVLRLSPRWLDWVSWLLMALVAVGALFLIFGRINQRSSGPAVVRLGGRTEITATAPGIVAAVDIAPGANVQVGDLLVRFYGAQELGELKRLEAEFELLLASRLRDPSDRGAEQSLLGITTSLDLARTRLEERSLRAPSAGTVTDVRVRAGQQVAPGQIVASIASGGGAPRLVALLPGEVRPQIEVGQPLRLELRGFRYSYQKLTVDAVSEEVLGPEEARRALGPGLADAAPLSGPVVLVEASLPALKFTSDGREYPYYDGLWGQAEVRLRSEPILFALVPSLKALWEPER